MTSKAISNLTSLIDINQDFPNLRNFETVKSFLQALNNEISHINLSPVSVIPQFDNIHD